MFGLVESLFNNTVGKLFSAAKVGFKPIRYFVDSHFRDHVHPIEGSVVYSDLMFAVEHSGIYVGNGEISNIVVTDFADSQVQLSDAADFTQKSKLGRKIYVSCRGKHAVGDDNVADVAYSKVGEQNFYGLVFKNCHVFSANCVQHAEREASLLEKFTHKVAQIFDAEWEPTILNLKRVSRQQLGANNWRLWDWDGNAKNEPEPDWQQQNDFFKQQALTPKFLQYLQQELQQLQDYQQEIADDNIPAHILKHLATFKQTLEQVQHTAEQFKDFIAACKGANLSHNDLQNCNAADYLELAQQMQRNTGIQELAHKMGRNYISAQKKERYNVPRASKSEVHGTHLSDDLMRLLPSELVNLEDETLEHLFYARLLEQNLQTYELSGITAQQMERNVAEKQPTGPVIACLDTSGSMSGQPLLKAKAALFAIANILQQENRALHVLLFGSAGQIQEYTLNSPAQMAGLMQFLNQGFNGGTDFESPLKRAVEIIQSQACYQKADVLMLSDGDCDLSSTFNAQLQQHKQQLDFSVYSVLCHGQRVKDSFSDDVIVL